MWVSPALRGSTHDLTAARQCGIIDALTDANVLTFADKGYQGAGGPIRKIRGIGERAIATLKTWKLRDKLHCCPQRATALLPAVHVLQLIEEQRHSG
jgi:hypothetical protein